MFFFVIGQTANEEISTERVLTNKRPGKKISHKKEAQNPAVLESEDEEEPYQNRNG